jgi:hypothetical protein
VARVDGGGDRLRRRDAVRPGAAGYTFEFVVGGLEGTAVVSGSTITLGLTEAQTAELPTRGQDWRLTRTAPGDEVTWLAGLAWSTDRPGDTTTTFTVTIDQPTPLSLSLLEGRPGPAADLTGYQETVEKGQPDGYASLDGTGKVPTAQLPTSATGGASVSTSSTTCPRPGRRPGRCSATPTGPTGHPTRSTPATSVLPQTTTAVDGRPYPDCTRYVAWHGRVGPGVARVYRCCNVRARPHRHLRTVGGGILASGLAQRYYRG